MRVLITGGTGPLGSRLAQHLLAQGHTVAILGRDLTPVAHLIQAGATPFQADLRDHAAIVRACAGMEVVVHAGALSAAWGKRQDFFAINVDGTQAVIDGCQTHGVGRLIYVSSPSVVFDGRAVVNGREDMPYARHHLSTYSLTKKIGEDRVNVAHRNLETVILRPKAIFGPGDRALMPRLLAAARRGRLVIPGDGANQVDLTYVDNVVHALTLALDAPRAVGGTYTITNGEHPRLWDVIHRVLAACELPTDLRHVPVPVALAAAQAQEWLAALTGHEPLLTRYSVLLLARTQIYAITAAQRDLGYQPVISLDEGIEQTLQTLTHGIT